MENLAKSGSKEKCNKKRIRSGQTNILYLDSLSSDPDLGKLITKTQKSILYSDQITRMLRHNTEYTTHPKHVTVH